VARWWARSEPKASGGSDVEGRVPGVGPISIRGIDHVVLRVRDLESSLSFYTKVLGAIEERRVAEAGLVQLRAGAALIDLVPISGRLGRAGGAAPGAEGRNVDHVALRLEHFDEVALRAHLSAHGVAPGEVERRYGAEGFGPSMYIRDPDGNVIELKGPPDSSEGR
jgi:glyoxylase I family protein